MLRLVQPPTRRSPGDLVTKSASDFLVRAPQIESLEALNREFERHVGPLGFDHFSYIHLAASTDVRKLGVLFGHTHSDWAEYYGRANLGRHDPALKRMLEGASAFAWSDLTGGGQPPDAMRVFAEARRFGLHEGYIVPVQACDGDVSAVILAGTRDEPLDRPTRARLNALATVYGMCGRSLVELGEDVDTAAPLSLRERRCLALFALGRNDWEISTELAITMQTVSRHFEGAGRKLGTHGRAEAVAAAARYGWLAGTLDGDGFGKLLVS